MTDTPKPAPTKRAASAAAAGSVKLTKDDAGFTSAAEALGLDAEKRPNKALVEGPEGSGSYADRADYLTRTLAASAGGGAEAEKAARPVAEDMARRQVDEVPSRAERESDSK